jgi:hypothetical protein
MHGRVVWRWEGSLGGGGAAFRGGSMGMGVRVSMTVIMRRIWRPPGRGRFIGMRDRGRTMMPLGRRHATHRRRVKSASERDRESSWRRGQYKQDQSRIG